MHMQSWGVLFIATHGLVYFLVGMVAMFRCLGNQTIIFLEQQLQMNPRKSDVEADVLENPESHKLAFRFAGYIMTFLGGLRTTVAFNSSCVVVIVLVHTFVSENIMICNELIERGFKGIGWIACVLLVNAALACIALASLWECAQ